MSTVTNDPIVATELRIVFDDNTVVVDGLVEAPPADILDKLAILLFEQTTAVGLFDFGEFRALEFTAQVVPLPASVWMLLGACAWLGVMARWMARR